MISTNCIKYISFDLDSSLEKLSGLFFAYNNFLGMMQFGSVVKFVLVLCANTAHLK